MPTSDALSRAALAGTGAVDLLEARLEGIYGMRYALAVSSATGGLLAVVLALDLSGAEFITTPLSWGGTVAPWLFRGNIAVFADVDPVTLTLDPEAVRRAITPRTRAIVSVDLHGVPADDDALRRVADEHGLFYIADAAGSFGATRRGRPASRHADALVLSLGAGKPLSVGAGGVVLTDDETLYERMIWFTQHTDRQARELGIGVVNEFALNARIDPFAAERAVADLDGSLQRLNQHRRQSMALLSAVEATGLAAVPDYRALRLRPSFTQLTASYIENCPPADLQGALCEARVPAHIAPAGLLTMYRQPAFLTQYAGQFRRPHPCVHAEAEVATRFRIVGEGLTSRGLGPVTRSRDRATSRPTVRLAAPTGFPT